MITDTEKHLITSSLERLECPPIELTERFCDLLFTLAPEVEQLFKGDMQVQYEKLLEMIMLVTHSLEDLPSLVVTIEDLGQRHVGYGAQEAHYAVLGQALIGALEASVKEWTAEDAAAWDTLYGYLSDLMITGAREA